MHERTYKKEKNEIFKKLLFCPNSLVSGIFTKSFSHSNELKSVYHFSIKSNDLTETYVKFAVLQSKLHTFCFNYLIYFCSQMRNIGLYSFSILLNDQIVYPLFNKKEDLSENIVKVAVLNGICGRHSTRKENLFNYCSLQ